MLAHLRFPVAQTMGRSYPEPGHPYRNPFQRDRDRVVHSRAFRRLEAKTQVFAAGLSDHFRNRLTHTIEVAQIARTLAGVLGLDVDLTEALALAHDIGHPPFAHAGEQELNLRMARFGDCFDHNFHALRIVESFEQRYARFPGLNLTFEVREGIVKHSRDFAPGERPEADPFLPGLRPPLEAQLIDLADEIAYNTADLDDAFSAGILNAADVAEVVPEYRAIYETVEAEFPGATSRQRFHEGLRPLINSLVSGVIEGTSMQARQASAETWRDVRAFPSRMAAFAPAAAETSRALKRLLHARVYDSALLGEDRSQSMAMIGELFQWFLDRPDRLPDPYRQTALDQPAHRVVCDYIAGMTDGFFRRVYEQQIGPPVIPHRL
jgi:dGTPase